MSKLTDRVSYIILCLIFLVKNVKRIRFQWSRRITFGVIGAVFLAGTYMEEMRAKQAAQDRDQALATYNTQGLSQTEYDTHWEDVQSKLENVDTHTRKRNIYAIFTGIFALGFGISVAF